MVDALRHALADAKATGWDNINSKSMFLKYFTSLETWQSSGCKVSVIKDKLSLVSGISIV